MNVLARLPESQQQELRRLCKLYEEATNRADLITARGIRGQISDFIGQVCSGDCELEAEMKQCLGFPVHPSPTVLDQ